MQLIPKMLNKGTTFSLYLCIASTFFQHGVDSANLTQAESLYNMLFTNYNQHMLPVLDLDDTVIISVDVAIVNINKFDEINGEIDITCVFNMKWIDERLTWTPSEYGAKTSLLIPSENIWHPKLYLLESFETIQVIGNVSQLVRIFSNGTVLWYPPNVLKVICTVDVTYFPFDTQTCAMSVSTWMLTKAELKFVVSKSDLDLSLLNANSQWDIQSGFVTNVSSIAMDFSMITIQITLRRRSDFFIVYIICPVIFLGCINNLVFVMPASSGERTSVAITAFLSFVVFMEMVNSNVPESSSPLAYIYYYILFLLLYSSVVLFLCVISLRIYDRDGNVPPKVAKIAKWLTFWRLKCRKGPVSPKTVTVDDDDALDKSNLQQKQVELKHSEDGSSDTNEVTWKIIAKLFDKYCCFLLFSVYVIYSLITFSRLYSNNGL